MFVVVAEKKDLVQHPQNDLQSFIFPPNAKLVLVDGNHGAIVLAQTNLYCNWEQRKVTAMDMFHVPIFDRIPVNKVHFSFFFQDGLFRAEVNLFSLLYTTLGMTTSFVVSYLGGALPSLHEISCDDFPCSVITSAA